MSRIVCQLAPEAGGVLCIGGYSPASLPIVRVDEALDGLDAGIPESGRELGPDVFLGDSAVDPLGDCDHAASSFELPDDAGPLP